MKKLFTFLLLLAGSAQAFSQAVTWGTPVTINTGAGSNMHPRIALNRSGAPYVLWGQTDKKAYFSKWTGSAFSSPVAVSGTPTIFTAAFAGPDMAAFGDTIYVAIKVSPEMTATNYCYLVHSYNGGTTFSAPVRIDNIDTFTSRFPIVTTTANGNPLVSFMKFNSMMGDAHYVVSRSTDYGMTFSADVLASGASGYVCDCCPASIISSGTKAVLLFRNNLSNIRDTWAGVSSDGGMTFPSIRPVDSNNWMIMSCPGSGPDGFVIGDSIYSVFMSTATGTPLVYFSRASISASTSKTNAITGMFSGLSSQNFPRIANAGNAAAAAWVQSTSSGKSIAYVLSSNVSSGFSGTTTVTGATGSGLMNVDVAMTPGAIHLVWQDDNTNKVMYAKGTYAVPTTTTNVSVSSIPAKKVIEVFPNPANENFTVSLTDINHISSCYLSDIAGRRINLTPVYKNNEAVFSLKGIAKGSYYFVMYDDEGKNYYSKLIVQ
jgi:hypothetical protein